VVLSRLTWVFAAVHHVSLLHGIPLKDTDIHRGYLSHVSVATSTRTTQAFKYPRRMSNGHESPTEYTSVAYYRGASVVAGMHVRNNPLMIFLAILHS